MGGYNQSVVTDAIRRARGLTRADIARTTGLSAQTVTNVTRRLLAEGLIVEGPASRSGPGRPGTLLVLDATSRYTVGLHLDPAAITLVALDLAGVPVARRRVPVPRLEGPEELLVAIVRSIDSLLDDLEVPRERVLGVGIATPGPVDVDRGVVVDPPHLRVWRDVPVRDELVRRTGLPAVLDKDVVAAASAHLWFADARQPDNALFVYLGTGVAMSAIVGGEVVRGASGNAGEAHHLMVAPGGPECACGRRGCFGAVLTAGALVREAVRRGADVPDGAARDPEDPAAAELAIARLAGLAEGGDALVLDVLRDAGDVLGAGAVMVCDLLDLDTVIVGGATWSRLEPWLGEAARSALAAHAVPGGLHGLALTSSPFGEEVGAIGAACLMLDEAFTPRPSDLLLAT